MTATLTSKGQITIPQGLREKFHLETGDTLDFDENAPFLKAVKVISPKAWDEFGKNWTNPWPGKSTEEMLDLLRGPVELPPPASGL